MQEFPSNKLVKEKSQTHNNYYFGKPLIEELLIIATLEI